MCIGVVVRVPTRIVVVVVFVVAFIPRRLAPRVVRANDINVWRTTTDSRSRRGGIADGLTD